MTEFAPLEPHPINSEMLIGAIGSLLADRAAPYSTDNANGKVRALHLLNTDLKITQSILVSHDVDAPEAAWIEDYEYAPEPNCSGTTELPSDYSATFNLRRGLLMTTYSMHKNSPFGDFVIVKRTESTVESVPGPYVMRFQSSADPVTAQEKLAIYRTVTLI